MRYYHIADPSYQAGDDLWCRDELEGQGAAPAWKWGEEVGLDTDVVCLFESAAEAEEFRNEFLPAGLLLVVDLPDDYQEWGIRMTRVSEGYPAVFRRIPAEFIGR